MALHDDGSWRVQRRIRYDRATRIFDGVPQFGFHSRGRLFAVEYGDHWVGELNAGQLVWTVGPADPGLAPVHVHGPLAAPRFVTVAPGGAVLITDAQGVHRLPDGPRVEPVVSASAVGVAEPGNCDIDADGHLWLNDITGHQVLELTPDGRVLRRFGDGVPGFQLGTVAADRARFGWIYDLRCGPDGRVYVLDSTNYAVRVIDPRAGTVSTICGRGEPGSGGDGGPAVDALLGGDAGADFDGPWSLVVDASGDVYIGDTHNHAVRRISAVSQWISTIASADSAAPPAEGVRGGGALFTRICGMDQDESGRLLVPDWVDAETDELVVLAADLGPSQDPHSSRSAVVG